MSSPGRVLTGARMHLVRPMFWLAFPWVILAASFSVSLLAAAVIDSPDLDHYGTGGLIFFYAALGAVYVQAVASLLPLAKGWSLTGRTFYAGTVLFAAVQTLAYGVVLYLLLLLERATNGWGVEQPLFTGGWFTPNYSWEVDSPALQVVIFAAPMFAFAMLGMLIGVLYRRFGPRAVVVMVGMGVLSVCVAITGLILLLQDVFLGYWLILSPGELFAVGPLILAVVFGGLGYLGSRRVVP